MIKIILARTRIMGVLSVLAFCLSLVLTSRVMAQDVAVIVNKDLSVSTVSSSDISKIFLGKKTTWDSGEKIVFAVCADPAAQEAFLKQYVNKSPSQYNNYWKSLVFTGKGSMPVSFNTKDEVTAFVSATRGAVSFVAPPSEASVKTITVQ